jgi:hypothetical protein
MEISSFQNSMEGNTIFIPRSGTRQGLIVYFKGYLAVPLTFGLYWPYFKMETEKIWRQNAWFGDVYMRFSGKGKDFLTRFIVALFLTPLTLGFYLFWFSADLSPYIWSHTHIGLVLSIFLLRDEIISI